MRMTASLTLSAVLLAFTACGEPECGDNENKVGKTCFPKDGSDAAVGSAKGQTSATTGQANASDAGGGYPPRIDAGWGTGLDGGSIEMQPPSIPRDSQVAESAPDASTTGSPSAPAAPPPCDGGFVNACNGCEVLTHTVGEVCSNDGQGPCALMGTYQCFAQHLICNAPKGMGSQEVCDGIDNNCNGKTDEGVLNACKACGAVPAEVCDGVDNNCDGHIDEGLLNACGKCGAVPAEVCDGADNNCDGQVDEGVLNACKRCGAVPAEVCDSMDNDCDGQVDEADAANSPTWYPDCDGDGYPALVGNVKSCAAPGPTTTCQRYLQTAPVDGTTLDCQDQSDLYNPGREWGTGSAAVALPTNGLKYDFDCNGVVELSSYFMDFDHPPNVVPSCKTGPNTFCDTCALPSNMAFDPKECALASPAFATYYRRNGAACESQPNNNLRILCR